MNPRNALLPTPAAQPPESPIQFNVTFPACGTLSSREVFATYLQLPYARIATLGRVPQGQAGMRLMALRYLIANGEPWHRYFAWKRQLSTTPAAEAEIDATIDRIRSLKAKISEGFMPKDSWFKALMDPEKTHWADLKSEAVFHALTVFELFPSIRKEARARLKGATSKLLKLSPETVDFVYLATQDLTRLPATTVSAGKLKYIIIADKGEMGVRAVREAVALGKVPVTLFSKQDDSKSLQVRLTTKAQGILIGLEGGFRESYANYNQIARRVHEDLQARFGEKWEAELARAALYPGYGPLAENAAAIETFRRAGIVFVGPMQDVVEAAGDKRQFRLIAQSLDPSAVTPGLTIETDDRDEIRGLIRMGHSQGQFGFPGRLKAANGGGGRGQAVVASPEGLEAAIQKVLGEIQANGWDPGVMFEQNIPETIHLEVQIVRDRFGNTRHFGMRDCTEQRASQKIQEEAPPALLRKNPELQRKIEETAVQIAEQVGYVGAGTIELMYKDGKYYFLEMNTRIQVEHPVTEECHAIRRPNGKHDPLNLVQLQMKIADGQAIDFEQDDIVCTHVGREFRINAEAWNPTLKDTRDGKHGLFIPNAGIFDRIELPQKDTILKKLSGLKGTHGLEDLKIRFDCGFEKDDVLVNKDPTFGKLIVSVKTSRQDQAYEALRLVCLEVLSQMKIMGRQVMPTGKIIEKSQFNNNIDDHIRVLNEDVLIRHSKGDDRGRHVNWVVASFRAASESRVRHSTPEQ